jgi:acetyl-CoA carboxylase, biotin carboxylase subunit
MPTPAKRSTSRPRAVKASVPKAAKPSVPKAAKRDVPEAAKRDSSKAATPIRSVLVLNRGEIAIRICRTLREMGLRTVAVFSDADRDAPHVFAADVAYRIGPAPASQSYLDAAHVIETARAAGADAVHPGYGFLAESADFAERVEQAGLVWIGPSPAATRALGDKVSARAIAIRSGVPVLPGTEGPVSDPAELRRAADTIGYPVVLKAAAGGGGKGMRRVNAAAEFEQAVRLTQGEARGAFGDDRLYLERWLERPRHIEVQILADRHGTVLALGERDCSVQRRHQKVVEETPSPALDRARRKKLLELAVTVAKAGGYTNAGTAEFLMDRQGRFYFLEMNARLQVEHPVTEMVLGLDLVREQIRIAQGERLELAQADVRPEGASLEFRVYAEDPDQGFLPDAGTVTRLELPSGPGVRCDFGVRSGGAVPVHYDPLVGKIIVWAPDRPRAIARARRALRECTLEGIRTTLPFHRWLLEQEAFVQGDYDTSFLAHNFRHADPADRARAEEDAAVLAAVFAEIEARRPVLDAAPTKDASQTRAAAKDGEDRRPMTTPSATTTSRWRAALSGLRTGTAGGRR